MFVHLGQYFGNLPERVMNQQSSSTRPPRLLQVLTTDFVASDGMGGMERAAIVMARELGHRSWSVRTLVPISPKTPALLK